MDMKRLIEIWVDRVRGVLAKGDHRKYKKILYQNIDVKTKYSRYNSFEFRFLSNFVYVLSITTIKYY